MKERTFCIACGSFCTVPNAESTNTTFLETKIPIPKELKLFDSNINYNKAITEIINSIGFDFELTINELNVLCEQCTVLLQEHQRFYAELKMIEKILIEQMNENYKNIINENSVPDMPDIQLTTGLLLGPEKNHLCDSNGLYHCQECPEYATLKEATIIAHIKCHQLRGQSFPFQEDEIQILADNTDEILNELLIQKECEQLKTSKKRRYENELKLLNINVGAFKCKYCAYKFVSNDLCEKHIEQMHSSYLSQQNRCDKCGDTLQNRNIICNHSSAVGDPLNCEDCEDIFYKPELLNEHYINKHLRCFKCSKQFRMVGTLQLHYKACVLEQFKCPACGYLCASQMGLQGHFTIHTGQQKYQCELCPKKFTTEVSLKLHQNTIHFKTFKYPCSICGAVFLNAVQCGAHKVLHDNPLPLPCSYRNCTQRFKTGSSRAIHVRVDHLQYYFHCEVCGKKFKRNFELKLHSQTHTRIGLYSCKYCSKRFTRPRVLRQHYIKKHPNELAIVKIET